MNTILSVVKNGRIEVDAPPDWPEGLPFRVELGLNGKATEDERLVGSKPPGRRLDNRTYRLQRLAGV